jgi:hypothetical protein
MIHRPRGGTEKQEIQMKSLREQIERSKANAARARDERISAEELHNREVDRLAREKAMLSADAILSGLPALVAQRTSEGHTGPVPVCGIGDISTLLALRGDPHQPGYYVLHRLEHEGYKLSISFDCSGNYSSNNMLVADL